MEKIKNKNDSGEPSLSAPWYTLQRILSYSVGQSGQVLVSELDSSNYQITITTIKEATATALTNTIRTRQELGNVNVNIVVKDISGKTYVPRELFLPPAVNDLIDFLKTALVDNPLVFCITKIKGPDNEDRAAIACTPTVIQFWNDDISNPSGFSSMLAEDAFREVFPDNITIYTIGKEIGNF